MSQVLCLPILSYSEGLMHFTAKSVTGFLGHYLSELALAGSHTREDLRVWWLTRKVPVSSAIKKEPFGEERSETFPAGLG